MRINLWRSWSASLVQENIFEYHHKYMVEWLERSTRNVLLCVGFRGESLIDRDCPNKLCKACLTFLSDNVFIMSSNEQY
jgi:hypothetical protein